MKRRPVAPMIGGAGSWCQLPDDRPNLLASLGRKPAVSTECLFFDPIADIAVLGSLDNQTFANEADAYEQLTEAATPLPVGEAA